MLNVVAIMGRLVADPELRTTTQGTNVCSFRIACDRNFARQGEQRQADFIDIVAWRQQAEFVSKYFQKGSLIAIEGSLQTRQYQDKNGNNRTAVEVVANNINFAGPKSSNAGNGNGYQNAAPSYQNAAPARPAAVEAAPSYSAGNADDFAVIDNSDDLPFPNRCFNRKNPTGGNKQWLLKEPKALAPHAPCVAAARRFAASVSIASTPSIKRTCPVCVSTSLSVLRSFPAV